MTLRDWLTQVRDWLGYVPAPDVGQAIRQQRAVTGGSVKVHRHPCYCDRCYAETFMGDARMFADAGLYDLAASALIAATGNGTCRVVNPQEAQ